jgi:hypothetical protein
MKRLSLVLTVVAALVFSQNLKSQDYSTAAGLRLGASSGLSIKHFVQSDRAIEGIVSTRWGGFSVTGLYEWHKPTNTSNLNWYYGAGAHIGFWEGSNVRWADDDASYTVIGADGILGLEYTFDEAPINLSLDWILALNVIGQTGVWGDGFGLSIRYVFN